jgi:hypothetical protein
MFNLFKLYSGSSGFSIIIIGYKISLRSQLKIECLSAYVVSATYNFIKIKEKQLHVI